MTFAGANRAGHEDEPGLRLGRIGLPREPLNDFVLNKLAFAGVIRMMRVVQFIPRIMGIKQPIRAAVTQIRR